MPEYQAARRISVYLSMPTGEIATVGIVRDALAQGKQVFIPYTHNVQNPGSGLPKSIMDMLELHSMQDFESLQPDKWNIPTPSHESIPSRANSFGGVGLTQGSVTVLGEDAGLDLIVMPGMAFDSTFGRLGHGKGYYDYFLRRCHDASRVPFRGKKYWFPLRVGMLTDHDSRAVLDRAATLAWRVRTHGRFRFPPRRPNYR